MATKKNNNKVTVAVLGTKVDNIEKRFDSFEMVVCKKIDELRGDVQELDKDYIATHTQTKSQEKRLDTLGNRFWQFVISMTMALVGFVLWVLKRIT